jgi:hypothetical protein
MSATAYASQVAAVVVSLEEVSVARGRRWW